MIIILSLIIASFLCQPVLAQKFTATTTEGRHISMPMPIGVYAPPPNLKDLKFKRGVSGPFEVLALDDATGLLIEQNINRARKDLLPRWGLPDVPITTPVRMMVVRDKDLFKRLFRIEQTRVETFRNYEGQLLHVVYLLMDKSPSDSINPPVTEILLAEFSSRYGADFGWWAMRGISGLNATPNNIRADILKLNAAILEKKVFSSESLFTLTTEQWYKLKTEQRELFNNQCVALCLLLRQEFGQSNLHDFLKTNPQNGVASVYRFYGFDEFDRSYKRYLQDIVREVGQNKTPTNYLTIKRAR